MRKSFLRRLFALTNIATIFVILVGAAASAGFTESFVSNEKVLVALVTLIAAQLLLDRVGVLDQIQHGLDRAGSGYFVELLPRSSKNFVRFSDFAKGAQDVLVIGVDMGFMAGADAWFIKQAVQDGMDLKILMCDPNCSPDIQRILNLQDERNTATVTAHDHVATAARTIDALKALVDPSAKGSLEIRARVDIPSPGVTMVDPKRRDGLIRVELKLYKRNAGEVPYWVMGRSSVWYEMFFDHYYVRLWSDSQVLYKS